MIQISVGNNIKKVTLIVDGSTTIAQAFDEARIEIGNGIVSINGSTLHANELCAPVEEVASNHCVDTSKKIIVRSIVKTDNAITPEYLAYLEELHAKVEHRKHLRFINVHLNNKMYKNCPSLPWKALD